MKVIGISGEMFAGKTTAAKFLEQRGFAYTRISQVIDDVLRERSEALTRENQQRVGLELHERKGQAWLCARAIDRLNGPPLMVVIDGLRWPEDAEFLRGRFGGSFLHIDVFAPHGLRRDRADHAGRLGEFDCAEDHPVESGVVAVGELADVTIRNDSSVEALTQKVGDVADKGVRNAS